jgi:hypothetical protein
MLFADFHNYLATIKDNDIYDYFNCYSTALVTVKDLKSNILNHRMNFLINYYIEHNKNINKNNLIEYYLKNYKDDFDTSFSFRNKIDKKINIIDNDDYDTDVKDHYYFMITKNPPKPEIDYDELDKKFYLEEEEKEILAKQENNYNEYDEYYDEYYNEYEEEYYNEDEDYYDDF